MTNSDAVARKKPASLFVIVVSDEDDHSIGPVE